MAIRSQSDKSSRSGRLPIRPASPQRFSRVTRPTTDDSRRELTRLLNEDFARECHGVFAYAVFAERYRDADPTASAECEAGGKREVAHAMTLCQLVYDFGVRVTAAVDDRAAVRRASRVARPEWAEETVRRLRERADQLRTAGRPHLANRVLALVEQKQTAAHLSDIVCRHADKLAGA